ncbi:MAG: DNA polymerase III subunit gamma/tau [Patescibacteria group bacterium]
MSLYRDYRPQNFNDIIGQETVVQVLRGALSLNNIGHAYIFAGPRGTGKTSLARVFAKAVNCLAEGERPCGVCTVCQQVTSGSFLDLIEIDAASNRGIDQIRDLKEKVQFMPTSGRYKVYIIDEAHMLTKDAFNALLKTLEEPPAHVIFILATTETHKIPITILSRCQRLDFYRIDREAVLNALMVICEKENIQYEASALHRIITIGEGSMRDTLSYLDQIRSFLGSGVITDESVSRALGLSSSEYIEQLLISIFKSDYKAAVTITESLYSKGTDFEFFLKEVILFLHDTLVLSFSKKNENKSNLEVVLESVDQKRVGEVLHILTDGIKMVRNVLLPHVALMVIVFDCINTMQPILAGKINDTPQASSSPLPTPLQDGTVKEVPIPPAKKEVVPEKNDSGQGDFWRRFQDEVKTQRLSMGLALQDARYVQENDQLTIYITNPFLLKQLSDTKNSVFLSEVASAVMGKKLTIVVEKDSVAPQKKELIDEALEVFGDGEIID